MRIRSISKVMLGAALLAAVGIGAISTNAGETSKKIRILYTDDMMGFWKPCG